MAGFINGSSAVTEYTYDANGNQVTDLNKGLTIKYNVLNLPQTVTSGTGSNLITYTYDATGRKLKKTVTQGGTTASTTYDGPFQFSGNVLDFMHTAEGRVRKSGSIFNYEYFLKDHLGNMRASFDNSGAGGTANLLQEQGYYPYGGTFNEYLPASPTKCTYQGKEYQDELSLNQYDFEARRYDPWAPYTPTPDPHAERYPLVSPHSWAMGNPMGIVDPTGMDGKAATGETMDQYRERNNKESEQFFNGNGPSGMGSNNVGGVETMAPSGYTHPDNKNASPTAAQRSLFATYLQIKNKSAGKPKNEEASENTEDGGMTNGDYGNIVNGIGALSGVAENFSTATIGIVHRLPRVYSSGWGGNGFVATAKIARIGQIIGVGTLVIGTTLDVAGVRNYYKYGPEDPNATHPIQAGVNLGIGLWSMFTNVPGWTVGTAYYLGGLIPGGWEGNLNRIGRMQEQNRQILGPKFNIFKE